MTLNKLEKAFGLEIPEGASEEMFDEINARIAATKIYAISMDGNPFHDVSSHATADVQVTQIEGRYYAATMGSIDSSIATEITE